MSPSQKKEVAGDSSDYVALELQWIVLWTVNIVILYGNLDLRIPT